MRETERERERASYIETLKRGGQERNQHTYEEKKMQATK